MTPAFSWRIFTGDIMPTKKRPTNLREWRAALKLKQKDAAAFLCLQQPTYSKIERHLLVPRPKAAQAISRATGVSLESILGL